jgi:hypothetical protein
LGAAGSAEAAALAREASALGWLHGHVHIGRSYPLIGVRVCRGGAEGGPMIRAFETEDRFIRDTTAYAIALARRFGDLGLRMSVLEVDATLPAEGGAVSLQLNVAGEIPPQVDESLLAAEARQVLAEDASTRDWGFSAPLEVPVAVVLDRGGSNRGIAGLAAISEALHRAATEPMHDAEADVRAEPERSEVRPEEPEVPSARAGVEPPARLATGGAVEAQAPRGSGIGLATAVGAGAASTRGLATTIVGAGAASARGLATTIVGTASASARGLATTVGAGAASAGEAVALAFAEGLAGWHLAAAGVTRLLGRAADAWSRVARSIGAAPARLGGRRLGLLAGLVAGLVVVVAGTLVLRELPPVSVPEPSVVGALAKAASQPEATAAPRSEATPQSAPLAAAVVATEAASQSALVATPAGADITVSGAVAAAAPREATPITDAGAAAVSTQSRAGADDTAAANPPAAQQPAAAAQQPGAAAAQQPGAAAAQQPGAAAAQQPGAAAAQQPGAAVAQQQGAAAQQPGGGAAQQPGGGAAQQPAAPAQPSALLDFTPQRQSGLAWLNDPQSVGWFSADGYHLAARKPGQFVALGLLQNQDLRDVLVSATFHKAGGPPGGGYGIILRDQALGLRDGLNQRGNYLVFEVGDKGEVGVWRRDQDQWVDILAWTPSPAVKTGTGENLLSVRAVGDQLELSVNGTPLPTQTSAQPTSGGIGVFLGGDANEAVLTRLLVTPAN